MGETAKVSAIIFGCVLLFCNIVALADSPPWWALALVDLIAGAALGLVLFVFVRFTEPGQREQVVARGLDSGAHPGKRKLMSRALVYAVVAVISLLTGLQVSSFPNWEAAATRAFRVFYSPPHWGSSLSASTVARELNRTLASVAIHSPL